MLNPATQSRRDLLLSRLFTELQIVRFNEIYYHKRAATMHRLSLGSNILATVASSTALFGLLSGFPIGALAWKILTAVAAISAVLGPVFQLEPKAAQFEKAALGHSIVRDRMKRLIQDLKMSPLEETHVARNDEITALRDALAALDEPPGATRLKEQVWKQVLEEYPSDQAWSIL